MAEPKDCRVIQGDQGVIISRSTAEFALFAMEKREKAGEYRDHFADDKSFIYAGMEELRRAVKPD